VTKRVSDKSHMLNPFDNGLDARVAVWSLSAPAIVAVAIAGCGSTRASATPTPRVAKALSLEARRRSPTAKPTVVAVRRGASQVPAARQVGSAPSMAPPRRLSARRPSPDTPSLARMVGQMVVAGMTGTEPDRALLARVRAGQVGGLILYGDNIESNQQIGRVIEQLQGIAREGGSPPLLISVDQEGGSVRRFQSAPPISPRAITTPSQAFSQGAETGSFLRNEGVNVDLAPIADVSSGPDSFEVGQGRGFNGTSTQVAQLATAFALGLQSRGVAACAKHFPGVGSLTTDTDDQLGEVTLDTSKLDQTLTPFADLIRAKVDMVMVASAIYPSLGTTSPADFSPLIINGLLRRRLGFPAVVITDALDTPPDLPGATAGGRAVLAAAAGDDIILYAAEQDAAPAYQAILDATSDGDIPRAQIAGAYRRILALKHKLTLTS